ncbi:hypothetical protein JCM5296_004326 [Sporobolomyces johnsonii]
MGGTQSTNKQPLEQLPPDDQPASPAESAPVQQHADLDMTLPRAEHAHSTTEQPSAVTPASAQPPPPPSADQDLFKVPALPSSSAASSSAPPLPQSQSSASTSPTTTLRALPADIEHILSLGADQDDKPQKLASGAEGQGELDKVVRELKAKAGMGAEGEVRMQEEEDGERRDELEKVEREMREKGVVRGAGTVAEQEQGDAKLDAGEGVKVDVEMDQDSDAESASTSDSDSSSSGFESDSTSRAGPSTGKSKRTRQRPARAASPSSDLSDDESGPSSKVAPKTEHELEPEPSLPPVQKLDEGAEIARFGRVESVIESVVVVKADTSGDWRVLDEGTVVCWEDKTVIGTIFETFGSVQQPFYSIRFPSSALPDPSIFTLQRPVFYSPSLAQFVFTRDLRNIKGSDASNVWDEEAGAGEIEFSDDEEEAEYKRRIKAERRARTQSATPAPSSSRQQSRQPSRQPAPPSSLPSAHLPARPAVSYADADPAPSTSTATASMLDMYGPARPTYPGPSGPRAEMGEKPPPGRVGRKMFERDTGARLAQGDEVEFEFSDGEGEGESDGEDAIAPLPTRASPSTLGLPPKPTFAASLPDGEPPERMSIDASQAPAMAPPFRFGEPTAFGGAQAGAQAPQQQGGGMSWSATPSSSAPAAGSSPYPPQPPPAGPYGYRPPPPQQASAGYYPPPGPNGPSAAYPSRPPPPPSAGYSPHQPQAFPSPPVQAPGGGHVNPRFLAQQQQQQQQAQAQGPAPGGQPGAYGGYGYGGMGMGMGMGTQQYPGMGPYGYMPPGPGNGQRGPPNGGGGGGGW